MRRRPGVAATIGLLMFGVMAAGFAGNVPESLRAAAALVVVLALPSILLARRARPAVPDSIPPSLKVPMAFLAWISVLAVWTALFTLVHASFRTYATATMWLFIVFYAAAAFAPLAGRARPAGPARRSRAVWIAVAACLVFAALVPPRFTVGDDSLDHVGYVRRIVSTSSLQPVGVLAQPVDAPAGSWRPDPRKGALHPVVAFSAVLAQAEATTVWRWLAVLVFPATVLAICVFNGVFLPAGRARVAAAVLILLTFHGNPFRFGAASAHGESLAALWAWTLTAAVVACAGRQVRGGAWLLLVAGGVLVHIGVAAHVLVLAGTVACFGGAWGIARADRLRTSAWLVAGTAAGAVLRARDFTGSVNAIHAHTQGVLFVAKQWFVASPMEVLRLDGMLFLGGLACVPLLLLAARTRAGARAILAAAAIPFAVSFIPWLSTSLFARGSYMVFRSLLNVPVYAAIVVAALWLARAWRDRRPAALILGLPAALVWLAVFVRPLPRSLAAEMRSHPFAHVGEGRVEIPTPLESAVASLPSGSVILSDPATSYALSAVTSHRYVAVCAQHDNPRDPYALDRQKAVRDVLSPYVMPDVAVNACRRFGVTFVVVNGDPPNDAARFMPVWARAQFPVTLERMRTMAASFTRVDSVAGACIYRFEPRAPVSWGWGAQDQPVRTASPALSPCTVAVPGGAFDITGISVLPERALPGDTVLVTFGYRHDAPSLFGLPTVMHVRFDHESLERAHEYPGEKIVRRASDRRSGVRSRFRADFLPGHGVYDPDLWPVGFALCETFALVVPANARLGRYDVRVAAAGDALVPNFHLRDILYNRDHYSGTTCASLDVVGKKTSHGGSR